MNRAQRFFEACKKDWEKTRELILNIGKDPNVLFTKMTDDNTVLHYIARVGDGKFHDMMKGYDTSSVIGNVNVPNNFGWTPLSVATYWRRPETMKFLLKAGANPRTKDVASESIVGYALNDIACTRVLYDHDPTLFVEPLNADNNPCVWHVFSLWGSVEVLSFLLAQETIQVPIDSIGSSYNCTALALAIQKDRKDLVNAFLEAGAKLELALPALKDTVPTWVVSIVLKTKNHQIARLTNDVEVFSEACWELTQKKRKIEEGEGQ
jgi:ankyrin repeat protein